jgi:hypothetical protein
VSLHKVATSKKDQLVGYLRIREPGFQTTRSRSVLVRRPDKVTGEKIRCWNVHTKVTGLFDKKVEDFFIKDIMQM